MRCFAPLLTGKEKLIRSRFAKQEKVNKSEKRNAANPVSSLNLCRSLSSGKTRCRQGNSTDNSDVAHLQFPVTSRHLHRAEQSLL